MWLKLNRLIEQELTYMFISSTVRIRHIFNGLK